MRRNCIEGSLANLPELKENKIVTKSYEFSLITPMFGGDVESFKINETAPVRSQSVKGQLRFWWRTMQGYTNKKELLDAETKIWGGSLAGNKNQSKVKVSVTGFKDLKTAPLTKDRFVVKSNHLASYVLFPATKVDEPVLLTRATFTITLTYPQELAKDAINPLVLWALFGGVGARTRRGCGSVYSEELFKEQNLNSIDDIKNFIRNAGNGDINALEYARIKGSKLFYSKAPASIKELQKKYGDYRQDRKPADPGTNHPGRSYWPEPDAIRLLKKQSAELHEPSHPDKIWFPRAAFGLPIMTHYNTRDNGRGDPEGTIKLEPIDADGIPQQRWPAPYFIKQLKLNGSLYDIMLVMNQHFPKGLTLDGRPVPSEGLPINSKGKVMNTKKPLDGRSIEKALADALGLEEAK